MSWEEAVNEILKGNSENVKMLVNLCQQLVRRLEVYEANEARLEKTLNQHFLNHQVKGN